MKRSYKSVRPGWKMTDQQCAVFWRMWGEACAFQGWDHLTTKEKDGKRYEVLGELGFSSLKDVDKTDGFSKVKNRLLELAGNVVAESDEEARKKSVLFRIGEVVGELEDAGYPATALAKVYKDFGIVAGVRDITALEFKRLLSLSITLTRIAGEWREKINL